MNCILLTPRVARWLKTSRSARIRHLFDEVVNLENDRGDLISLVTSTIGPGPFSMILPGDFPRQIKAEMTIRIDPLGHSLKIGRLTIDTSQARLWNPVPPWPEFKNQKLTRQDLAGSLAIEFKGPLDRLLRAIVRAEEEACQDSAFALAGLGGGLTPAGDDILMGVLYGLWVWYPVKCWMEIIADTAVPRTTALSAAFLKAAADGEATIHWHQLIAGHDNAVEQIVNIGQSSGADAWSGFVATGKFFQAAAEGKAS